MPLVLGCLLVLLALGSCKEQDKVLTAEEQLVVDSKLIEEYLKENNMTATRTPSGLYYQVLREGNGEDAVAGKTVKVHYIGKFLDGSTFDSSYSTGNPYVFRLGYENDPNSPIKAWHQAVALMNKGDEFRIFVPSGLAYGRTGSFGRIPPNAVLMFEMDLLDVR
jgi:FKBP-type peptidyl-prolyl cis-trans isomerase